MESVASFDQAIYSAYHGDLPVAGGGPIKSADDMVRVLSQMADSLEVFARVFSACLYDMKTRCLVLSEDVRLAAYHKNLKLIRDAVATVQDAYHDVSDWLDDFGSRNHYDDALCRQVMQAFIKVNGCTRLVADAYNNMHSGVNLSVVPDVDDAYRSYRDLLDSIRVLAKQVEYSLRVKPGTIVLMPLD